MHFSKIYAGVTLWCYDPEPGLLSSKILAALRLLTIQQWMPCLCQCPRWWYNMSGSPESSFLVIMNFNNYYWNQNVIQAIGTKVHWPMIGHICIVSPQNGNLVKSQVQLFISFCQEDLYCCRTVSVSCHEAVKPLAWLIGRWKAVKTHGSYPTIKDFRYGEEIEFFTFGQPNIQFS